MLEKFGVKGFKNFSKDYVLDLTDRENTYLIYGKNGSGKSNLGYAIFDIVGVLTDKYYNPDTYKYFLNLNGDTKRAEFRYQFRIKDVAYYYGYIKDSNNSLVWEVLYVDTKLVFEFNHKTDTFKVNNLGVNITTEINGSLLRYLSLNNLYNDADEIIDYVNRMIWFDGSEVMGYFDEKIDIIQDIVVNHSDIVDDLNKLIGCNAFTETLEIVDGTLCYVYGDSIVPFLNISSLGIIERVKWYYLTHVIKDCTFLFVDNIDSVFHFSLADQMVLDSKNLNCQVLITTYNLRLMSNRFLESNCFYIIDDRGVNSIDTLTNRNLKVPFNLSKLYTGGEFDSDSVN